MDAFGANGYFRKPSEFSEFMSSARLFATFSREKRSAVNEDVVFSPTSLEALPLIFRRVRSYNSLCNSLATSMPDL